MTAAARLGPGDTIPFGNGIEAHCSVVSAICCFSLNPSKYDRVITRALSMGGDVDTIAAMAGALAGTHLGIAAIPGGLIHRLEDGIRGRRYLVELSAKLAGCGRHG